MSLISSANFVAPLRSKVQIVGILALAVLVAVVRLTGSGSRSADSDLAPGERAYSQSSASGQPSVEDDVESFLASRRKGKARDVQPIGDIGVDRLLQGDDIDAPSRRGPAQASRGSAGEPEKLNDIKRSLGLE